MRSCSMQAEVASELGRLRASVGGLEDTRADLTKQIADELHRLYSQCRGGNHVVGTSGVAGGGKGEYEREAFAALLRESSALHEVESELRFQGDVIRLKDDLTRSLAEVQGLPAEEFGQKLEGLRSSVEVMQVICTSFGENRAAKTKGANSGLKPLPFSGATRAFLLSMCQQLRRELAMSDGSKGPSLAPSSAGSEWVQNRLKWFAADQTDLSKETEESMNTWFRQALSGPPSAYETVDVPAGQVPRNLGPGWQQMETASKKVAEGGPTQ